MWPQHDGGDAATIYLKLQGRSDAYNNSYRRFINRSSVLEAYDVYRKNSWGVLQYVELTLKHWCYALGARYTYMEGT